MIAARELDRARRSVDVLDALRAAGGGIDAECARVRKQVDDGSVHGERARQLPVFALIEKEPGLLAADNIGFEAETCFQKDNRLVQFRSREEPAIG